MRLLTIPHAAQFARQHWLLLIACVNLAVQCQHSYGQQKLNEPQPVKPDSVAVERINRLILQLGHRDYQTRKKATAELWRFGRPAIDPLIVARKSDNREIAKRAAWLLERLSYGILPNTPAGIVPLLNQYRDNPHLRTQLIREFTKFGEKCIPILQDLRTVEQSGAIREQISSTIRSLIISKIWQALRENDLDAVETRLRSIGYDSTMHRSYAAFFALQNRLPEVIPELHERHRKLNDANTARQLAICYRAAGEPDRSLVFARDSDDQKLLIGMLLEAGRWDELAIRKAPLPHKKIVKPDVINGRALFSRAAIEYYGFRAGCLRLSGHQSDADRLLDSLIAAVRAGDAVAGYRTMVQDVSRVLILNDRANDAIQLIVDHAKSMPYNAHFAFELLCAQDRYEDAFEFAEGFIAGKSRGYDRLERELWVTRNELGDHRFAKAAFLESFRSGLKLRSKQRSIYATTGLFTIGAIEDGLNSAFGLANARSLDANNRTEWDVLFSRGLTGLTTTKTYLTRFASPLPHGREKPTEQAASHSSNTAWIENGIQSRRASLLLLLRETFPDEAPRTMVARARFLFGLETISKEEIGPLTKANRLSLIKRLAVSARRFERYALGKAMEGLAFLSFQLGEFAYGRNLIEEALNRDGQASELLIADSFAHTKKWAQASKFYSKIENVVFAQFADGYCSVKLAQTLSDRKDAQRKQNLLRSGQAKMQAAALRFLDRASSRNSGITRLVKDRGWFDAQRQLVAMDRRSGDFGSVYLVNAYSIEGNSFHRAGDWANTLLCWERARLSKVDLSTVIGSYRQLLDEQYSFNIVRTRLLFEKVFQSSGNRRKRFLDAAIKSIWKTQSMMPARASLAVEFAPVLRRLGLGREADRLVATTRKLNAEILKAYPNSGLHQLRISELSANAPTPKKQ